jgi:hypothetical protein
MKRFNRNLKSLENKTGKKIKSYIQTILDNKKKYKDCYFWIPPCNANSRRQQEFKTEFSFLLNSQRYEVHQSLDLSCKNFYFATTVKVEGQNKNITALKKLMK